MALRMTMTRAQTAPPHRKTHIGNSLSRTLPALDLVSDMQHHGQKVEWEELPFHGESIKHDYTPADSDESPVQSESRLFKVKEADTREPREGN
eukprot:9884498-Karenia_brevis.AAC.1